MFPFCCLHYLHVLLRVYNIALYLANFLLIAFWCVQIKKNNFDCLVNVSPLGTIRHFFFNLTWSLISGYVLVLHWQRMCFADISKTWCNPDLVIVRILVYWFFGYILAILNLYAKNNGVGVQHHVPVESRMNATRFRVFIPRCLDTSHARLAFRQSSASCDKYRKATGLWTVRKTVSSDRFPV